ncbi:MAG: ATP-binding cassette domain-containing protein [Gammaproteobacteria bacterium]|nr:ATP-binding cassette domain-containing protein [Gammaproteobacteria bacterium]
MRSLSGRFIEFEHIVKSYNGKPVIRDVTLALPENTTSAIVGESGAGKSTLLQLVNGLVLPDSGTVRIQGRDLDYGQLPRIRRTMGYSVQGAGLFPHLTVRDNVTLVARLEGWPAGKIRERYNDLLALFGLDDELSERFPYGLSGGQAQRVGLCRAMMLDPPLLLLDEPFSGLDSITRTSIYREMLQLAQSRDRSILLVTHDINEAAILADHLVILKQGKVIQQGSLHEIKANPADGYVRELLLNGNRDEN